MRAQIRLLLVIVGICGGAHALSQKDKKSVVNEHNYFRSIVQPPATDMKYMTWHEGAAELAQDWADACRRLTHNKPVDREFGKCGQNIFVSTKLRPWSYAIEIWYNEEKDFTYGGRNNNFAKTGHYTQVVWADSYKVGCGIASCKDSRGKFYNYVCNYCPAGNNRKRLSRPYTRGTRCGSCPNSCYKGLCYDEDQKSAISFV